MQNKQLEDYINEVDYHWLNTQYVPTSEAVEFINFIKLVNGAQGEENKTPVMHIHMVDTFIHSKEPFLAVVFRGGAKTTVLHEYAFLFIAVYGHFFHHGKIDVAMYVSDTMENGVKSMRQQLQFRWENSEFMQKFVPKARFAGEDWEFTNLEGNKFFVRGFGATTGVRGFKRYGKRPTWCHAVGTEVQVGDWKGLVEDYPNRSPDRHEEGLSIKLAGLPFKESVTKEHMYHGKHLEVKRHKKYLPKGDTKSTTSYEWSESGWVHAEDLTKYSYIGSPISTKVGITPTEHVWYGDLEFWWMYGLWLGDGGLSEGFVQWYIADTERDTVGKKVKDFLDKHNKPYFEQQRKGCSMIRIRDRKLHRILKAQKRGNSCKAIPTEWEHLHLAAQKEILLGYIAADGYEDYTNNQIRCNSVYLPMLLQLGKMSERLGLPYHIRKTKQVGKEIFPNGQECNTQEQHEIRFREDVSKVLGLNIENQTSRGYSHVFIEDGFIWRKVEKVVEEAGVYVPIHTPNHVYTTSFGLSHNCGFDDLMSDKNAKSPTILEDIEAVVYKAARQAMHPKKRIMVWTGTPFSKADSLYKAAGSSGWKTCVYPVCERFPCEPEEFRGAWEDRFTYEFIKAEFTQLMGAGKISAFNQELMLRVTSQEDRLIQDSDIQWYSRSNLLHNPSLYNFYITTDFATSESQSADFSVISVWALNNAGYWFLVDGVCARQTMDKNMDDLFRLAKRYSPKSVGIEVSGQQGGFIQWTQKEMMNRNIWFNLASDNNSGKLGIRPNGKKLVRFNTVVPWFKAKRMFFPEELRGTDPLLIEMEDELRYVTKEGFKSAHDDACSSGDTLIKEKLANGKVVMRRFDQLVEGSLVHGYCEVTKEFKWVTVQALCLTGYKPTYTVEVNGETQIHLTGNHPVLTQRGWVEVSDLTLQDSIVCKSPNTATAGLKRKVGTFSLRLISLMERGIGCIKKYLSRRKGNS